VAGATAFTEHRRFKQVTPEGTTLYIAAFGVLAEVLNPGTTTQKWTEYVSVGNVKVGMRVLNPDGTLAQRLFFQTDHLGSISVLTNGSGGVVQNMSYDAWGKRRNPNGTDDTTGSITSQATRGFTDEEELSVAGLIHLNGRVGACPRAGVAGPGGSDPGALHQRRPDGVGPAEPARLEPLFLCRQRSAHLHRPERVRFLLRRLWRHR